MKGIIFSGESVPGVLAGTKTQSRRTGGLEAVNEEPDRWRIYAHHDGVWHFMHMPSSFGVLRCEPRYQLGETVYMKEAFQLRQWVQD